MKKKSLLKRIAAVAMSAALALGMMSVANAATIDQENGTLQIQKLKTGTTNAGIAGVQFNYLQVGSFELDAENQVNGFTITDSALKGYLTDAGLTAITGTTDVYDGGAIQDALNKAMETETTKTAIEAMATKQFQATNENGQTDVVNVPVGIYLVVETSAPAEVTKMADPFIVSVPILNAEGNAWTYDVVAQPKNDYIDAEPEPEKMVVDEQGNEINDPSAKIGETVNFKISSTVPEMAGDLVKFDLIDTLSEGLTLGDPVTAVTAMTATNADGIEVNIKDVQNLYTVTKAGQVLTVAFDPAMVQDAGYTNIAVTYTATLNEKAIVGSTGTANEFKVQYTNDPDQDVDAQTVYVDTYGFTLQKNNENGAALEGATFKLYDAATGGNEVSFYTGIDAANNVTGDTAVTEVTTDADGHASFYGLAKGTYYLEETKAPAGYNLLKERVKIEVTADTTDAAITDITIVNTKGFTLPSTGGMGTVIFTVVGIVIMVGAAIMLIRVNKKSKAK